MPTFTWKRTLILIGLSTGALILAACHPAETQAPSGTPTISSIITPFNTVIPSAENIDITETSEPLPIYSGPFKMIDPIDEILSGSDSALVSTADGSLWLISKQKVTKIHGDNLSVYLDDFQGQFAGVDATGRVWVVSEDTALISAWNGQSWTAYGDDKGWTPLSTNYGYFNGGQSDLQGRLWFTTSQDVRSFDGTQWTIYPRDQMGMEPPVYDDTKSVFTISVLKNGDVWVGECDWGGPGPFGGGGARRFVEGEWQGETSPAATGCVNTIIDDSLGRVWVGVDSSLWRYDPASGGWEEFSPPESPIAGMRFGFINSQAVDSNNEVWAELVLCGGASCYGNSVLYHLHDGEWNQVGSVGEYDSGYWGPVFDANGIPWVYREGGIFRIKEDVPELVTPLTGRFGTRDNIGRVWFIAPYENREMLWVLDEIELE